MAVTLYGFNGCDTVKKARRWLEASGVTYDFFDYRRNKLDPTVVADWFERAGWETVFNRGSTAFRALPVGQKSGLDAQAAQSLILTDTNFIKRPVLDTGGALLFGFRPDAYVRAVGA